MTITLRLHEKDTVVGSSDTVALREYVLGTFDTLSHAMRVSDEHENRIVEHVLTIGGWSSPRHGRGSATEYSFTLVDRHHPHHYGDVIRTTWLALDFGTVSE